jgi:hypothetical protein
MFLATMEQIVPWALASSLAVGVGVEPGTEAIDLAREYRTCARLVLLARIVARDPGLLQTEPWIATEGKALLLTVASVLPESALGAGGRDLQVQTAGIGQAHAGLRASQLAFLHCLSVSMEEQNLKWLRTRHLFPQMFPQMFPQLRCAAVGRQEPS